MKAATVISTKQFATAIDKLLTADELAELECVLAMDPTAHPVIPGTGGVRKARWSRTGMGKRGGIRVIYFYVVSAEVVLLLGVYAKNEKENLTNEDKRKIKQYLEEETARRQR